MADVPLPPPPSGGLPPPPPMNAGPDPAAQQLAGAASKPAPKLKNLVKAHSDMRKMQVG